MIFHVRAKSIGNKCKPEWCATFLGCCYLSFEKRLLVHLQSSTAAC
jgi:hypothetical protein